MTRLIDADALLVEFATFRNTFHSDEDYQDAMMIINFAPTVHRDNSSPAHSEWEMPEETRRQLPTPNPPTK